MKYLNYLKSKKVIVLALTVLLGAVMVGSLFKKTTLNTFVDASKMNLYAPTNYNTRVNEQLYTDVFYGWMQSQKGDATQAKTFGANDYVIEETEHEAYRITQGHLLYGSLIDDYSVFLNNDVQTLMVMEKGAEVSFVASGIDEGLYQLVLDHYDIDEGILPNEISIKINGQNPFFESRVIALTPKWQFTQTEFLLDRYKNEIQPRSEKDRYFVSEALKDQAALHSEAYRFLIKDGDVISIESTQGSFILGNVELAVPQVIPSYESYLSMHSGELVSDLLMLPAETMANRNNPTVRLRGIRDASSSSYDTQFLKLNVIDGASWQQGGNAASWNIEVSQAGYYHLTFKYQQYMLTNMPAFREVKINGSVPFDGLAAVAFPYTRDFVNRTLTDEEGTPYKIYLNEGVNTITLTTSLAPYRFAVESLKTIMQEITALSLDIKRLTGNSNDRFRDWDIELYLPETKDKLLSWATRLDDVYESLLTYTNESSPAELLNIKLSANRLRNFSKNVNRIPSRMIEFSDGDASVSQMLGDQVQRLMRSHLELENTYLHGNQTLPRPNSPFYVNFSEGIQRLFLSFFNNQYKATQAKEGELTVWVNLSRPHIEILQNLIDTQYDGPLKVSLSLMPDENKLILANATNRAPDLAIGVNHWIPYEFAIRDASLDLRTFEGYEELVSEFAKGAMIPYAFEEGIYGLPMTQNFWVTYYRNDLLESIGINEVPQTWDQIIDILPVLQSFGMNYFSPISQFEGFKPFVATLPYIYQFGGQLYKEDGMSTNINSEETLKGVELMTELFTLYNLPQRVPNFYNHFRYGTLPIGIGDLSTYLLLSTASPEIQGLWDIALHPGVYNAEKDEIIRYAATGGQASMILSSTKHKEEAWDFLKWWMSSSVQTEYAFILQTTYGQQYLWNTANLVAFDSLAIPQEHKEIILKQWEYAIEASRIPGAYMVERELSNAWNKIVFDGVNPRLALDEAVRISNREILYKMEEFGYVRRGVVVKNYPVPNIDNIDNWLTRRVS